MNISFSPSLYQKYEAAIDAISFVGAQGLFLYWQNVAILTPTGVGNLAVAGVQAFSIAAFKDIAHRFDQAQTPLIQVASVVTAIALSTLSLPYIVAFFNMPTLIVLSFKDAIYTSYFSLVVKTTLHAGDYLFNSDHKFSIWKWIKKEENEKDSNKAFFLPKQKQRRPTLVSLSVSETKPTETSPQKPSPQKVLTSSPSPLQSKPPLTSPNKKISKENTQSETPNTSSLSPSSQISLNKVTPQKKATSSSPQKNVTKKTAYWKPVSLLAIFVCYLFSRDFSLFPKRQEGGATSFPSLADQEKDPQKAIVYSNSTALWDFQGGGSFSYDGSFFEMPAMMPSLDLDEHEMEETALVQEEATSLNDGESNVEPKKQEKVLYSNSTALWDSQGGGSFSYDGSFFEMPAMMPSLDLDEHEMEETALIQEEATSLNDGESNVEPKKQDSNSTAFFPSQGDGGFSYDKNPFLKLDDYEMEKTPLKNNISIKERDPLPHQTGALTSLITRVIIVGGAIFATLSSCALLACCVKGNRKRKEVNAENGDTKNSSDLPNADDLSNRQIVVAENEVNTRRVINTQEVTKLALNLPDQNETKVILEGKPATDVLDHLLKQKNLRFKEVSLLSDIKKPTLAFQTHEGVHAFQPLGGNGLNFSKLCLQTLTDLQEHQKTDSIPLPSNRHQLDTKKSLKLQPLEESPPLINYDNDPFNRNDEDDVSGFMPQDDEGLIKAIHEMKEINQQLSSATVKEYLTFLQKQYPEFTLISDFLVADESFDVGMAKTHLNKAARDTHSKYIAMPFIFTKKNNLWNKISNKMSKKGPEENIVLMLIDKIQKKICYYNPQGKLWKEESRSLKGGDFSCQDILKKLVKPICSNFVFKDLGKCENANDTFNGGAFVCDFVKKRMRGSLVESVASIQHKRQVMASDMKEFYKDYFNCKKFMTSDIKEFYQPTKQVLVSNYNCYARNSDKDKIVSQINDEMRKSLRGRNAFILIDQNNKQYKLHGKIGSDADYLYQQFFSVIQDETICLKWLSLMRGAVFMDLFKDIKKTFDEYDLYPSFEPPLSTKHAQKDQLPKGYPLREYVVTLRNNKPPCIHVLGKGFILNKNKQRACFSAEIHIDLAENQTQFNWKIDQVISPSEY